MYKHLLGFVKDESGAVTVDWVVLTAALVGLGAVVIYNISSGTTQTADSVGNAVGNVAVGYSSYAASN